MRGQQLRRSEGNRVQKVFISIRNCVLLSAWFLCYSSHVLCIGACSVRLIPSLLLPSFLCQISLSQGSSTRKP